MTRHFDKPCRVPPYLDEAAVARFRARTDRRGEDDCWIYQASTAGRDRSRVMVGGILYPAAVLAWVFHHREMFPVGMEACHSCDNPRCVNPKHIWPGTHQQNIADCIAKGRARKNPDRTAATKLRRPICKKGHPESATTYWGKAQVRRCKMCVNEYDRAKRLKRKAAQ